MFLLDIKIYLANSEKHFDQHFLKFILGCADSPGSKEVKQNWAELEKFDISIYVISDNYCQSFYSERKSGHYVKQCVFIKF